MAKSDFNVVIMHGRGSAWRSVRKTTESSGYCARVLILEPGGGTIFDRLRDVVWEEIHCAVIVLTGDDPGTRGRRRVRQNVVFELGYCYGAFDSLEDDAGYSRGRRRDCHRGGRRGIVLKHPRLRTVRFQKGRIAQIEEHLRAHLDHAYECAKDWYELDD